MYNIFQIHLVYGNAKGADCCNICSITKTIFLQLCSQFQVNWHRGSVVRRYLTENNADGVCCNQSYCELNEHQQQVI